LQFLVKKARYSSQATKIYSKVIIAVARNRDDRNRAELLRALQENCDRPNKDLAYELGMDASALSRAKDRLEKEGVVKEYKAVLNAESFGFTTLAFIKVALQETNLEHVVSTVNYLSNTPGVQEIHSIEGPFDMFLKFRAKSNKEVLDFILAKLTIENNVKDTEMMLILATHKETTDIPI
jgi:Lrp/AsnC family leucine-responsive transcriptional regulator